MGPTYTCMLGEGGASHCRQAIQCPGPGWGLDRLVVCQELGMHCPGQQVRWLEKNQASKQGTLGVRSQEEQMNMWLTNGWICIAKVRSSCQDPPRRELSRAILQSQSSQSQFKIFQNASLGVLKSFAERNLL